MTTKLTVWQQVRGLQPNFWYANWMEANERLAFFGARAILPLYMVYAVAQGGMGLTYAEKGNIYAIWALIQCLVPMVSGGFTDQYGYKKSLYVAYAINIVTDSIDQVSEIDEANNSRGVSLPPPDLIVLGISWTPADASTSPVARRR